MMVCSANAGPITYFVVKTLFDACWLLAIEGFATLRSEIFVENWGLTLGSFPPDDPDAIEVYFLEPEIWDDINAFIDEHGSGCTEGCKVREFSS